MTNEKGLIERAGLAGVDALVAGVTPEPRSLAHSVARAGELLAAAMEPMPT
ncbi:hypothetical protein ACFW5S_18840 [Streptomyces olivaceus]|uniref:hypothetical protein n=1 Tax=Streptomyces olivaceus TaxID=47716 RepID=UPI0033A193F9